MSARVVLVVGLILAGVAIGEQRAAAATGPTIVVVHWDVVGQCISGLKGSNYLENVDKDTLPNEWYGTDPLEALKAGASIIRTDAYWFHVTPESDPAPWCAGVTPFTYDFRDSRMNYVPGGGGNRTANSDLAVDATNATGWRDAAALVFLQFNSCLQNGTVGLANFGWTWDQIVSDPTDGVYSPSGASSCGITQHTQLAQSVLY